MRTLFLCLLICLCGFAVVAEPNETVSPSGRYQLVTGKLDVFSVADASKPTYNETVSNTVFKIDTATGKTWYVERTVKPGPKDSFIPVEAWVLIEK